MNTVGCIYAMLSSFEPPYAFANQNIQRLLQQEFQILISLEAQKRDFMIEDIQAKISNAFFNYDKVVSNRLLGKLNNTDKEIWALMAKYGPVLRVGKGKTVKFINLKKSKKNIEDITLEDALELIKDDKNFKI